MPLGQPDRPLALGVVVETIGEVLVLRTEAEAPEPLVALATALPPEPGRTAVLSAPSVTGRPDLFEELLPDVLIEHLGGSAAGIRLVALGRYARTAEARSAVQQLADWIGQEVVFPVAGLDMTAGAASVLADSASEPGAVVWELCGPGQPAGPAPSWLPPVDPVPALVDPAPPLVASASGDPAPAPLPVDSAPLLVDPAPALLDPEPAPLDPEPAPLDPEPAPLDPEPAPLGSGWASPFGVAGGGGLRPAPPNWPADNAWRLVALGMRSGFVAVPRDRPDISWLPPRPMAAPPRAVPVVAAAETAVPGVRTRAGWSFLEESAIGAGPVLAGFVIEVRVEVTGFRVDGRPLPPRSLARMIAACRGHSRQPVVVLVRGMAATGSAADLLYGGLADALAVPVYAADAEVSRTATGLLKTTGTFRRWNPRAAPRGEWRSARRVLVLGEVLPPLPVAVARRTGSVSRRPTRPGAPVPPPSHATPAETPPSIMGTPIEAPPAPVPASPPASAAAPAVGANEHSVEPLAAPAVLGPAIAALLAPQRWLAASRVARIEAPVLPMLIVAPVPALDAGAASAVTGTVAGAGANDAVSTGANDAGANDIGSAGPAALTEMPPEPESPSPVALPAAALSGLAIRPPITVQPAIPSQPGPFHSSGGFGFAAGSSTAAGAADAGTAPPARTATRTPPVEARARVTTPEARPGPAPRWLADADIDRSVADRAVLRQAVGGRYDAHARVVSRTLAESPGLRAAAGAFADLTAGLVAVRAYCDGECDVMNQVLRGTGPEEEVDRITLLARCATYGLRRLPTVLGPVFRAGPAKPDLVAGYRPGDVLTEPAFVDVDLAASPVPASGVEFAIWSVSAHRLDSLCTRDRGSAVFQPGSRFQVLAVDNQTTDDVPVRVLLRDLTASYRGGRAGQPADGRNSAERILSQLRAAHRVGAVPGRTSTGLLSFAPGLDDTGRPFLPPVQFAGAVAVDEVDERDQ
jgi:hypothetical protein